MDPISLVALALVANGPNSNGTSTGAPASPSSHMDAPRVLMDPLVDSTDFYAFRSYEPGQENTVTLIANYAHVQSPSEGPVFRTFDPRARYEIHIDNDGDAREDITYRFRFRNQPTPITVPVGPPGFETLVEVPFKTNGPVTSSSNANLSELELFTIEMILGDRETGTKTTITNASTGSSTFQKPVDNIGSKTIADYSSYADDHVYDINLPGGDVGRVFVGQRKDSFAGAIDKLIDLIDLDLLGPTTGATNEYENKNISTIAIEVPIAALTAGGDPVIGAWTTASLPRTRKLMQEPTRRPSQLSSPRRYDQVSRMAAPLISKLLLGMSDKDKYNQGEPKDDGRFLSSIYNPALPELIQTATGLTAPNFFPRADLGALYTEGFFGLNLPQNITVAEMLRLDTSWPATPAASQLDLGPLVGDPAGFPNGRRPGDDAVDITLRIVMGALLDPVSAPSGLLPYTDGVGIGATDFDTSFPYLLDPIAASE